MTHNKMSIRIEDNYFAIEFANGASRKFNLPDRQDKEGIKGLAGYAVQFAIEQGATIPGQVNAVRKGLTERGYNITHPRGLGFQ